MGGWIFSTVPRTAPGYKIVALWAIQYSAPLSRTTWRRCYKQDYCILAGDYNINLLNHETHAETGQFLNNIYAWSYLPVIIRPTRFTETSATLIDNIFTNISHESALTGILIADISDQLTTSYISKLSMPDNVINSNVKYQRLIDDSKIDNFCAILSQSDYSELYPIEYVNLCYD